MHIWIPIEEDNGLKSRVCPHFGSAPNYILVDSDTMGFEVIANRNAQHEHGNCQPLHALIGHRVDAVVVEGIGLGALMGLHSGGILVYSSQYESVEETVRAYIEGQLSEVTPANACSHHNHSSQNQEVHNRSFAARYRTGGCGGEGCC